MAAPPGRPRGIIVPSLADVTAADDRGLTYALRSAGMSTNSDHPDRLAWPQALQVRLDPAPARETGWIELRGRDGTAARLLPSPRVAARIGRPAPLTASPAERELLRHTQTLLAWTQSSVDAETLRPNVRRSRAEILGQADSLRRAGELDPASELPAQIAALADALIERRVTDGLPAGWAAMMTGAERRDGTVRLLDLTADLPPFEDVILRPDTLLSLADSWRLYLRVAPAWYKYGQVHEGGGQSVREVVSVSAEDDRCGAYISHLGGSPYHRRRGRERRDHEEHFLRFQPRLDPLAGALHLTFRGLAEEAVLSLDLS